MPKTDIQPFQTGNQAASKFNAENTDPKIKLCLLKIIAVGKN